MSETTTGTGRLRQALIARNSKVNLTSFARDLSMSGDAVHAFLKGGDLTPDRKRAVADYLFGGSIVWDEKTDCLMPAKREVRVMGPPPTLDLSILPKFSGGAAGIGPQPVNDSLPSKPKTRAGWLGGWG